MNKSSILLVIFLSGASSSQATSLCELVFGENSSGSLIVQQYPNRDFQTLDRTVPIDKLPYKNLKRIILDATSIEPYGLIRKRKDYFRRFYERSPMHDLILNRAIGQITGISELEVELIARQNAFQSLSYAPSEFYARVFTKGEGRTRQMKVIYFHSKEPCCAIENFNEANKVTETFLADGWQFEVDIHNHPFYLGPYFSGDIGGSLSPSDPDLAQYVNLQKKYGLKEGRITNGFHTIHFKAEQFPLFPKRPS